MAKLQICRICLSEDVRMFKVVNNNLRELFKKLTDIPFVTADRRPTLLCFFCCAELKHCFRLMRKCLEADEQFTQIMNKDYKPNPPINQDHIKVYGGFIRCPIEHISIVDTSQTESIAIKEELLADCNELEDITEPQEDRLSNDLPEAGNIDNSCLNLPPHHSKLEVDVREKTAEEVVPEMKRRAVQSNSARVTRRTKLEETITAELKKNKQSNLKVFRTTRNRTYKPDTSFEEPDDCDQRSLNKVKKQKQYTQTQISKKCYECDVCQRSFSQKYNLIRHIRIHTGVKPYKCHVCQRSYTQKNYFAIHIRSHTGEKPFKCDVCQCNFILKSSLRDHIRIHTGEKPYKCDLCLRSFTQKTSLTRHIRTHTGEKPFKCDVCQCSFTQKNSLTDHTRKHTGEKPYKCDVCLRSFPLKNYLAKHIRTHTGEKPYKCDVCQHSFRLKGHLIEHIRIHTGDKPYKCDVCQRRFTRKHTLDIHVRNKHPSLSLVLITVP